AQLGDVAGAGRIRVPVNRARQLGRMLVQRSLALVVFAKNPEHVLAIEDAPDGRERIVEAEIDSPDQAKTARARSTERQALCALQFHGQDLFHAASELRVNQSLLGLKAATVLLVEPGPAKRAKLFIEKRPANSRNL